MTFSIETRTYKDNEGIQQTILEVITPICLMDSASLIVPKPYKDPKTKIEKGDPKFSVRALFDVMKEEDIDFKQSLFKNFKVLLNGKTRVHSRFAANTVDHKCLVKDFIKVGSEYIEDKKMTDSVAEPGAKKEYSAAMDYLNNFFFFYSKSKKQVAIKDKFGKDVIAESDDFFNPSFFGKLKMNIKLIPNTDNPGFGGKIITYLQGVQYIKASKISYISTGFDVSFEEADGHDDELDEIENRYAQSSNAKKDQIDEVEERHNQVKNSSGKPPWNTEKDQKSPAKKAPKKVDDDEVSQYMAEFG